MKKIIIAVGFMLGFSISNAQTFDEGTSVIQAAISVGGDIGTPISASYEYGVTDEIGVGVFAGYASKTLASVPFLGEQKFTYTLFGVRGNYHFYTEGKLDAYAGLIIGYNQAKVTYSKDLPEFPGYVAPTVAAGGSVFGGQVGARYYFTDNLAALAELGYGLGYLNIGLAYKL